MKKHTIVNFFMPSFPEIQGQIYWLSVRTPNPILLVPKKVFGYITLTFVQHLLNKFKKRDSLDYLIVDDSIILLVDVVCCEDINDNRAGRRSGVRLESVEQIRRSKLVSLPRNDSSDLLIRIVTKLNHIYFSLF